MNFTQKLKNRISSGHERTVRAKKNILLAIFYRGIGILVGFAISPLSLAYLDQTQLGIFILISTTFDWFEDLDLGVGKGMKNKVGEAVAKGKDLEARAYISSAYGAVSIIFASLAFVFIFASFLIPWSEFTKTDPGMNSEIRMLAIIVCAAFAIRFVSSLIYDIFGALQETAKIDFYHTLTKVTFLVIMCLLIYSTESSLLYFGASKSFTFAFIPLIVGFFAFRKNLRKYAPSILFFQKKYLNTLLSLGGMFFLIRVAMVVIYQTNTLLITTLLDVSLVPIYDFSYKYFSILLMLFVIITNQLWPAYVEAYAKNDYEWMRTTIDKIVKIWLGSVVLGILMVLFSQVFYFYWINVWQTEDKIMVFPLSVSIFICMSVCMTNWVNAFNLVLNGTGKIRLQMYAMIFAAIINIPASIFFTKTLGMGIEGIILGTLVSLIPNAILAPVQVKMILRKKDKGIWSK
ncbi:MAG: hypothetical protein R8P61_32575 [Bacteroidia bacterium]|nr:hypothetical protein [Bacteroidia bacterium]